MGPNGSGKSTLAQVLAGCEQFTVVDGTVSYDGQDLLALTPEERARRGLFLGFQYPVEIPGSATSTCSRLRSTPRARARRTGARRLRFSHAGARARLKINWIFPRPHSVPAR